jgi:hypothetical protein
MPDPTKKTISATQTPALWNLSPYYTRWMLYHHFANGMPLDSEENARMAWGKKLQPLIVEQAAQDLHFEVRPNADDTYHRRGLVGCTRDATIICPSRGPGALETKCVFDYRYWMQDWRGGEAIPKPHEIQLQQQMMVGDEDGEPYKWGVIAAWVAGDVHYFEREPVPEFWTMIEGEARDFFQSIADKAEPEPFGVPLELPWLNELFPVEPKKVLDLSADGETHLEIARMYANAKEQEAAGARTAEPLRARLLALAKDAEEVLLPFDCKVRIRPHGKGKRITVQVPETAPPIRTVPLEEILNAG